MKLKVEQWPIEKLKNYPRNARTHSDVQIASIAASIGEFGFVNPVLVDKDGRPYVVVRGLDIGRGGGNSAQWR